MGEVGLRAGGEGVPAWLRPEGKRLALGSLARGPGLGGGSRDLGVLKGGSWVKAEDQ